MKTYPLSDVAEVLRGITFGKSESFSEPMNGTIPVLRAGNIQENLEVDRDLVWIPENKIKTNQLIKKDDIVMCTSSGSADLVGKCAKSKNDWHGSFGAFCAGIRPNKNVCDPSYLYYFLKSPGFSNWTKMSSGANIKNIRKSELDSFEIPLPPLPEQKRIAAILDKADAIRRKRQQAIQLADQLLRAVFLDMFGDPNSNPKGTKVLPMTECFDICTGKLNSNAGVQNGKYPFFTCAKEVFSIDDYAFDQEALLLAGNNAQAEYDVKHYNGKFNAYQRTYVLTLKNQKWSYQFYKFALDYQLSNLKRVSKGSNTKYITMEIMSRTMLPVPAEAKQNIFVQYFDKLKSIQENHTSQALGGENLFSSLSQKAFAGEL